MPRSSRDLEHDAQAPDRGHYSGWGMNLHRVFGRCIFSDVLFPHPFDLCILVGNQAVREQGYVAAPRTEARSSRGLRKDP
jgi:hypothetical protein